MAADTSRSGLTIFRRFTQLNTRLTARVHDARAVSITVGWYVFHLTVVYISVRVVTPWIAGRIYTWALPFVSSANESDLGFLLSHIFAFSFIPALCAGLVDARFDCETAMFVWIIPSVILTYQCLILPAGIMQSHVAVAYHEYFAGGFAVPRYRNYGEMFALVGRNPDILRGIQQLRFTAPFYAAVAYSLSGVLRRFAIRKQVRMR